VLSRVGSVLLTGRAPIRVGTHQFLEAKASHPAFLTATRQSSLMMKALMDTTPFEGETREYGVASGGIAKNHPVRLCSLSTCRIRSGPWLISNRRLFWAARNGRLRRERRIN
jgi:hypothetical protein